MKNIQKEKIKVALYFTEVEPLIKEQEYILYILYKIVFNAQQNKLFFPYLIWKIIDKSE